MLCCLMLMWSWLKQAMFLSRFLYCPLRFPLLSFYFLFLFLLFLSFYFILLYFLCSCLLFFFNSFTISSYIPCTIVMMLAITEDELRLYYSVYDIYLRLHNFFLPLFGLRFVLLFFCFVFLWFIFILLHILYFSLVLLFLLCCVVLYCVVNVYYHRSGAPQPPEYLRGVYAVSAPRHIYSSVISHLSLPIAALKL